MAAAGQGMRMQDLVTGVAWICATVLIAAFIPLVGMLICLFLPLPAMYYRAKLGREPSAIVLLISLAIVGIVFKTVSAGLGSVLFFALAFLGFVMAEQFDKQANIEKTVMLTAVTVVVGSGVATYGYCIMAGIDLLERATLFLTKNLEAMVLVYSEIQGAEQYVTMISANMSEIVSGWLRIMPSLLLASALFVTWVNLLVGLSLMRANRLAVPDFGALNEWKSPEYLVWSAIGCGILLMIPVTGLRLLGFNGLIVLLVIYFFQGIAIVAYWLEVKKVTPVFRIVFYIFIASQQLLWFLVVGLGFFDLWGDFRRLKNKTVNGGNNEGHFDGNH